MLRRFINTFVLFCLSAAIACRASNAPRYARYTSTTCTDSEGSSALGINLCKYRNTTYVRSPGCSSLIFSMPEDLTPRLSPDGRPEALGPGEPLRPNSPLS